MKRALKILFATSILVVLTGCGQEKKEIVTHCTLEMDNTDSGYKLTSEYDVYSTNGEVSKVVTKEVVTSENQSIIEYFEEYLQKNYKAQNDTYGGTDNKLSTKEGEIVSTTTIDYNKMDLDKFVKDNSALKNFVNDNNKLKKEGVISLYETMGATCK